MVAVFSTPKHVPPVSSIPRRPSSFDFEPVYCTTVETDHSSKSVQSSRFPCWTVLLYILFILLLSSIAVYYCVNSATMDIRLPRAIHNHSFTTVDHRVKGRMKDSQLKFVQFSFYAMARFQHPDSEVIVDSITVSVYNGAIRVGGGEYFPSVRSVYPFIQTKGDITEITMLPKSTLLEGEEGYEECSSDHSSSISLRLFFSILVHRVNVFGNEIKGRIEYSQVYSVCCSCLTKHHSPRHH